MLHVTGKCRWTKVEGAWSKGGSQGDIGVLSGFALDASEASDASETGNGKSGEPAGVPVLINSCSTAKR